MLSIGIDVSKGKSTVCGMKPGGEIVYAPFEVQHTREGMSELVSLLRSSGEERILVVINPADREVSFGCAHVPQETLYRFGGEIALKDGIMTVPAQTVGWFKI